MKDVDDVYALSVVAYALQLAQHKSKYDILMKLLNKSQNKGKI